MNPKYHTDGKEHILYDADASDHVDGAFFELSTWQRRNALVGTAHGRGAVAFVRGDGGAEYVVRHYRRGGLPARFSRDRYLWLGLTRTRAWREWHLLATLHSRGLPAPRPVAVRVVRERLAYSADIVTARIDAPSLGQRLGQGPLEPGLWRAVGGCIRRFHEAGVCHADLNAHNILLDGAGQVHLVDFDRGRFRARGEWMEANLARLRRSLRKLASLDVRFGFHESDWEYLEQGYR